MTIVQLSIPFPNTLKLSDKHKCTLIASQSKRLGLEDWEVNSLIQLCKAKGWISKGLALLYRYAGYIDEFQELLSLFNTYSEELINYSSLNIIETLGKVSLTVIRTYFTLACWRKIQFSPRPIFIIEGDVRMGLSEYFAIKLKRILEVTRKVSMEMWTELNSSLLKEVIVNVFGDEIWKSNEESSLIDYNWLSNLNSSSSTHFIKQTILELISLEAEIYAQYNQNNQSWPVTAVLFLPYPEVRKSIPLMNWFLSTFDKYQQYLDGLANILEETLLIHSTLHRLDAVASVMQSLQEERFRTFFEKSLNKPMDVGIIPSQAKVPPLPFHLLEVMPLIFQSPLLSKSKEKSSLSLGLMTPTQHSEDDSTIREEPPSFATELDHSKFPKGKAKSHSNGNVLVDSVQSSESTVLQNIFSPKPVGIQSFSSFDGKAPVHTIPTADKTSAVSEDQKSELNLPVDQILHQITPPDNNQISPTSHSVEDRQKSDNSPEPTSSNLNPEISPNPTLAETNPPKPQRPSVNFSEKPSIMLANKNDSFILRDNNSTRSSFHQNNNDIDDLEDYDGVSVRRGRAQSDHVAYGADSRNFFNRERIISDPRGLSVEEYVHKYQVNKGRKTKRFNNTLLINRMYRFGRLRRIDFSFTSLSAALKIIDLDMKDEIEENQENPSFSKEDIVRKAAARKISVWYMIISPRRKLMKRLTNRNFILEIVVSIADQAFNIGQIRGRRRNHMLRVGAAVRIQKMYRNWVARQSAEELRMELEERKRITDRYFLVWIRAVKNGIRLYRYLKWLVKKKIIRKAPPVVSSPVKLRQYYVISIRRILEGYIQLYTVYKKFDMKIQLQRNKFLNFDVGNDSSKRGKIFREYGQAVTLIQAGVRRYLQRKKFLAIKKHNDLMIRLTYFLNKMMRKRRARKLAVRNAAATKIQRFGRGIIIRKKIFAIVHAGLKLNFMWRRYVAYKSLKSQLRRVDRPYTVVLHGLRDLPKKFLTSDQIKVKLSVWWHPLLHIVSANDFAVILQSKQPQYIFVSGNYKVTDAADNTPIPDGDQDKNNVDHKDRKKSTARTILERAHFSFLGSLLPGSDEKERKGSVVSKDQLEKVQAPRQPTGYNPFSYGRKQGTSPIVPRSQPVVKPPAGTLPKTPSTEDKKEENKLTLPPLRKGSLDPVNESASESTPQKRKNSKKKSIRMSQNILPPSSLLNLALFEEDEEEEEEEEDDDNDEHHIGLSNDEESAYPLKPVDSVASSNPGNLSPVSSSNVKASSNSGFSPNPRSTRNSILQKSPLKSVSSQHSDSESEPDNQLVPPRTATGMVRNSRSKSILQALQTAFSRQQGAVNLLHTEESEQNKAEENLNGNDISRISAISNDSGASRRSSSDHDRKRSLFANLPSARSTRASVIRTTINFALKLRSMVQQSAVAPVKLDCICNFDEAVIKIPGCHGNSVFKFEILEGDRKISQCLFYLGREGQLMYWGGEYQLEMRTVAPQRRAAHMNRIQETPSNNNNSNGTKLNRRASHPTDLAHEPKLDFRVIAGAPLRSKCQWARVIVRGKGPLKRTLNNRDFMNSFNIFDNWNRFYLSLDEFGLYLFENKFLSTPFHIIPVAEFRSLRIEIGFPIRESIWDIQSGIDIITRTFAGQTNSKESNQPNKSRQMNYRPGFAPQPVNGNNNHPNTAPGNNDKSVLEDIHNVILTTITGDEVYMRFPDTASRNAWHEVLGNAMLFAQNGKTSVNNQISTFSWLSSAFSPKKKNLAANTGDPQINSSNNNNNNNNINNNHSNNSSQNINISSNNLNSSSSGPPSPTNKSSQSLSEVKLNSRKVIFASRGNSGQSLN